MGKGGCAVVCRVSELRYKELINVTDGSRYGWVGDAEVDLETGQVRALVVPGRLRLFGLLGRGRTRWCPGRRCAASARTSSWRRAPPAAPSGPGGDRWLSPAARRAILKKCGIHIPADRRPADGNRGRRPGNPVKSVTAEE